LESLSKDKDNEILASLKDLLQFSFEVLAEEMEWQNQKSMEKIITVNEIDTSHPLKKEGTASKFVDDRDRFTNLEIHFRFVILVLRFLQLLCEGHNNVMQNILRV